LPNSSCRSASRRCCDSLRLSSSLPRLSEWPSISTLRLGYVLRNSASLWMLRCAPGPTLVLPASKSTSPIVSTRPRSVGCALRLASSFASAAPLACSAARACASASTSRRRAVSRAVAARFGRTDDDERMRLRPGDLVQIPLRVADHVVLALRGVGPGRERGRAHAGLVLLAQVPVLDARELPERQQRVER